MSAPPTTSVNILAGKKIDDIVFHPRRVIEDSRGDILHFLRADSSLIGQFGEVYMSAVQPNAVKAWKRHRRVAQNLIVPVGEIRFVVFDNRTSSPSYGSVNEYVLSRQRHGVLHVPCQLWYGFEGRGASESLIVNIVSEIHDPDESDRLPLDDSSIPYRWRAN